MNDFEQIASTLISRKKYSKLYKHVQNYRGEICAQYFAYLGLCYENGYGVKKNEYLAIKYYIKATLSGASNNVVSSELYMRTWITVSSWPIDEKFEQVTVFANLAIANEEDNELFWRNIAIQYANPMAYYYLGEYYYRKGNPNCFCNFKIAYDEGVKESASYLALCYDEGLGVNKNTDEAMVFYKTAAELGDVRSQFMYAEHLFIKGDISKAHLWCRTASNNGNYVASIALCLAYSKQFQYLTKEDVELFKITSQTNPQTQYILAIMSYIGRFVEQDWLFAEKTLERLANEGYKKAIYALGIIRFYSLRIWREDRFRDYYESMLSACDEIPAANYVLGQVYNYGLEGVVEPNPIKAYKYFESAANENDVDAMVKIAFRYLFGIYTSIDVEKAYEWFLKSSDISLEPEGCACLGIIFEKGLLGKVDIATSESWYKKAIEASECYPNGESETNDFIEALRGYQWDLSKLKINDLEQENEVLRELLLKASSFDAEITKRLFNIEVKVNAISRDVTETNERTKKMEMLLNNILDLQKTISAEKSKLSCLNLDETDDEEHMKFFDSIAQRMNKTLYQSGNASVDYEEAMLKGLFGKYWDRLDEFTKKALVSARVFLANCGSTSYGDLDYSGVCISICSALEQELKLRFFTGYKAYLRQRFQDDFSRWPKSMKYEDRTENNTFSIGKLPAIFGSKQRNDETGERKYKAKMRISEYERNLLNDYIKTIIDVEGKDIEAFFEQDLSGLSILDRCEDVRCMYRNAAAHTESLSIETAVDCCRDVIGVSRTDAAEKVGQVQGLIYDIVKLLKIPVFKKMSKPYN